MYNIYRMKKDKKEKINKQLMIMVQPTLLERFKYICGQKDQFKTVSEVIRELMVRYIESP